MKGGGSERGRPFNKRSEAETKRVFDASKPAEASAEDIRKLDKSRGIMPALIGLAEKKGAIALHSNNDTGWGDIALTKTGVRSVIRHSAGDGKLAVMMEAKKLIRQGTYLESTARNEYGLTSHIFAGKVILDGVLHVVGFVVNEDFNGKTYYNHEMTEMDKALGGTWPNRDKPGKTSTNREPILSIVRRHLFVK